MGDCVQNGTTCHQYRGSQRQQHPQPPLWWRRIHAGKRCQRHRDTRNGCAGRETAPERNKTAIARSGSRGVRCCCEKVPKVGRPLVAPAAPAAAALRCCWRCTVTLRHRPRPRAGCVLKTAAGARHQPAVHPVAVAAFIHQYSAAIRTPLFPGSATTRNGCAGCCRPFKVGCFSVFGPVSAGFAALRHYCTLQPRPR